MPVTPQRGFIVRPTQEDSDVERVSQSYFESPIQSRYYAPQYEGLRGTRVGLAFSDGIEESNTFIQPLSEVSAIRDLMLSKIAEYLEANQLTELTSVMSAYSKFKELHP